MSCDIFGVRDGYKINMIIFFLPGNRKLSKTTPEMMMKTSMTMKMTKITLGKLKTVINTP